MSSRIRGAQIEHFSLAHPVIVPAQDAMLSNLGAGRVVASQVSNAQFCISHASSHCPFIEEAPTLNRELGGFPSRVPLEQPSSLGDGGQ